MAGKKRYSAMAVTKTYYLCHAAREDR